MFFSLLKLALVLSLVNARSLSENVKTHLLGGQKQVQFLAECICNDLEFMLDSKTSQVACQKNFMSPAKLSDVKNSQPTKVSVRCRSERTLQVLVEPSNSWQLLVLVPETEDNRTFSYSLVEPHTNFSKVSVASPSRNHFLYSTALNKNLKPSLWHALKIPAIKGESKHYDVQITFMNHMTYDGTVNGVVTWNHTGDSDLCFEVFNICSISGSKSNRTWPENDQRVVIERLHPDDTCEVSVKGLYGTTNLKYQTPSQDAYKDLIMTEGQGVRPEIPRKVSIMATEDGDAWSVRVGWAKPSVTPDRYNVTLRADDVTTLVVPANATEVIFTDVTGAGRYNVSVMALKGRFLAHKFAEAVFPGSTRGEWVWSGAGGWGAGALVAAALAAASLRLRNRIRHKHKPKIGELKPLDKGLEGIEECCEDQWEIKAERLLLHEVIGEGAFGVVRRGTLAPTGKEVAVKMLKDFPSLDEVRSFRLEMDLMKSVGAHGHVVSLLGCCSGKRPLIVAQYCARGDLLSFLRRSWDVMVSKRTAKYYNNNNDTSDYRNDLFKCNVQHHSSLVVNKMYDLEGLSDCELTSLDLLSFCRQIAMGMEFLAANRLVHRDLAARNVLVTEDRTLKIADFGLSRDVYEENQYKQKGNGKMPVKWMAPESLTRRIYTTQSDVWSFGVVVWEVVSVGGAPYPGVPAARLPRLLRAGYRMPRPPNCSTQLYELMLSCWSSAPRARPTFSALHARLDELLNCACAHTYLSLELDDTPVPKTHAYRRMILRGKRAWNRETYERPLKAIQGNHNHYTSPPVTLAKAPA